MKIIKHIIIEEVVDAYNQTQAITRAVNKLLYDLQGDYPSEVPAPPKDGDKPDNDSNNEQAVKTEEDGK